MKVTFWTYVSPNGDGGSKVLYFNTEAEAYKYKSADKYDEGNEEDICEKTLLFNDNGKLTKPDVYKKDE